MHARIDGGNIQLLTRTSLDWSHRYKRTIEALRSLKVKSAYLDGELCALHADVMQRSDRHISRLGHRRARCSNGLIYGAVQRRDGRLLLQRDTLTGQFQP
jgi:hypothetical protein